MYISQAYFGNSHSFLMGLALCGKEAPVNPSPMMIQFANIVLSVLDFLASPTGGRDIGRGFLHRIGLRSGYREQK
jgi:hypothetical protein